MDSLLYDYFRLKDQLRQDHSKTCMVIYIYEINLNQLYVGLDLQNNRFELRNSSHFRSSNIQMSLGSGTGKAVGDFTWFKSW